MAENKDVRQHISKVRALLNELEDLIGMDVGGPVNPPVPTPASPGVAVTTPPVGDEIDPAALPKDDPTETVEGFHKAPAEDEVATEHQNPVLNTSPPVTTQSPSIPPSNITGA